MNRAIKLRSRPPEPLNFLQELPESLTFPLKEGMVPCVRSGEAVVRGQVLAKGTWTAVHASLSGQVSSVNADSIRLDVNEVEEKYTIDSHALLSQAPSEFAKTIGLVGMGGAGFPAAIKWKGSVGLDYLIINAVECEPFSDIDQGLIFHFRETVLHGAKALQKALGIKQILLAVRQSFVHYVQPVWEEEIVSLPDTYPGGAERLIVSQISDRYLPAGQLPATRSCLVHNTATLYWIGKSLEENLPVISRPLGLINAASQCSSEWIVPIGICVGDLLKATSTPFDADKQQLVAGGVMMGRQIDCSCAVEKTMTALTIVEKSKRLTRAELPCTGCGSCNDVCPLGLHPIAIVERLRKKKQKRGAFEIQLNECFLCGACSAVCPSDIPLADEIRRGRNVS